jgi:hypothetical protein
MSHLDDQLKAALRNDALDQPGIIEMAASNFRGRQRFVTLFSKAFTLAVMAVMIWCVVAFFQTADVRDMIFYATLFLYLGSVIAMLKLWFWLMMIRYSIARELKRLELQFGLLAQKQAGDG